MSGPSAGPIDVVALGRALGDREGCAVDVVDVTPLVGDRSAHQLKQAGYGAPLLVSYRAGGATRRAVFRTQSPNWFGHDRRADRADLCLLAADTFGDQPRHVAVRDVGAIRGGELLSLHGAGEFYLLTEYVDGALYADDLQVIERTGRATARDLARVEALADHLAALHTETHTADSARLHARAMRDLLGSGEGIFGIVDGYPADFLRMDLLRRIEELALGWRWRVKAHRATKACRTHGDFHPYNVLFREGVDFTALDASRGGHGDPADDLAAMSINFLFGALRCPEAWRLGFRPLFHRFFERYLAMGRSASGLARLGPFLAWRALVLASPVWYPAITDDVRERLLDAAVRWLEAGALTPHLVAEIALGASDSGARRRRPSARPAASR